jgi:tetratricopeptide (TPR) repeat protein
LDRPGIPAEPARPKTVEQHLAEFQTALRAQDGEGAIAALRAAVKLDPKHRVAVANLSNLLQVQGMQLAQAGNMQQAYAKFLESASLLRGFRDEHKELSAQEQALVATALYNEACAFSMQGDANKALQSLRESFEAGFDDLAQAEKDPDLIEVRKLGGYPPLLEAQQAKLAAAYQRALEAAREAARKLLAEHSSFPFDFELTDLDDKPLKLADSKGKVTIVDFWSTSRPQSRMTVPQWVQLQTKYQDEVRIVGLNYEREQGDAAKEVIRKFIADNGVNYPCALGDEALQRQVPQPNTPPTTLFLDRTGKVRLKVVGVQRRVLLEAIIIELLAEAAPVDAKSE